MRVRVATRVFGSEVTTELIRYYRSIDGSMRNAAKTLGVPYTVINENTQLLIDAGVVVRGRDVEDKRRYRHTVDETRLTELITAYMTYVKEPRATT